MINKGDPFIEFILINSSRLFSVSKIAKVALYPNNHPFAVPGLITIVLAMFNFCN